MKKYFFISILLFIAGCDLFTTRSPEEPTISRASFTPATTPEILFENLKSSFQEKIVENYVACFVDPVYTERNFRFIPSAGAATYPVNWEEWNIRSEEQYFRKMISEVVEDSRINLNLEIKIASPRGDSANYEIEYNLLLEPKSETLQSIYEGSLEFKIIRDERNQWVIAEWRDFQKEDLPSWSDLKGITY